jgi:hypothetical protein
VPTPSERRPVGFAALGVFFYFGSVMAAFAALTLAVPGTFLDTAWKLNPEGHNGLAPLGRVMALPFLMLAGALLFAAIGWFRRRPWGWTLGLTLIAVNFASDVLNVLLRHEFLKGGIGVVIAGILLAYMASSTVRAYFRRV